MKSNEVDSELGPLLGCALIGCLLSCVQAVVAGIAVILELCNSSSVLFSQACAWALAQSQSVESYL